MEEKKTIYPKGMFVKRGMANFVKAKIGINIEQFTQWAKEHQKENGWINIDILEAKDGLDIYAKLDDWKPAEKPDFHTSPTDGFPDGIDLSKHPLNSDAEQKKYDEALKDW